MSDLDYTQVHSVVLGDYETGADVLTVDMVGNIVFVAVAEGRSSVGINYHTLKDALRYLRADNKKLEKRVPVTPIPELDATSSPSRVEGKAQEPERISWERYALNLAHAAMSRSEDPYVKVGACILREDHTVASVGYNGAPPGIDMDWSDRDGRRKRVIHAEANALRYIRPGEGTFLAATMLPCLECLKSARAYGITDVVYDEEYTSGAYDTTETLQIASEFGVNVSKVS